MANAGGFQGRIPPSGRLIAGLVLALSNFMVVLDMTVANVSVPHIAGSLGITLEQGTWIITSYAVAEAICVPLTGWLAQRFGTVRMFIACMIGFGLFSVLCGVSLTLGMIVFARIGQGLCGGPLMPLSQTLLLQVFPPEQRGRAMGLWAMTTLLGPAMGPIIGGYISDNWSWHWIFFINVPVAVMCVLGAITMLRPLETPIRNVPIDRIGLVLLIFWIGCLQVMLDIGRDHDWFADPMIVALAIMALVGFLAFVIWELTEEHPVVDLRVFRHRGFSFGVMALALSFGAYFASIVVIPQWMQSSLGYPAADAGLATALTAIASLTTSMIAARMMTRVDPRLLISLGVAWIGVMAIVRSQWTSGADFWSLALPQLYQGFAVPFFFVPLTAVTLGAVLPEETASAAGLQSFLRTLASAIATSLVLTAWGNSQRVAQNEMAATLNPDDAQRQLAQIGADPETSRNIIGNIVSQEAMIVALDHIFLLTAVLLFAASMLIWITPRPARSVDPSAAH